MGLTKFQRPVAEKNRRVVLQTADAALVLDPELEDGSILIWTGVITADRAVTLPTGRAGVSIRVTRAASATGAFNLDVGTGPLKVLAVNEWADFTHDGTAFALTAHGGGIT
jgi:hypothetical protein